MVRYAGGVRMCWRMTKSARNGFLLAAAIFLLDQASKLLVLGPLDIRDKVEGIAILPIFRLIYVQNHGISLGMFTANSDTARWLLVAVTGAISIGAGVWLAREKNRFDALGLGMIVGGAAGNVLDRVRFGYVTDFLNLHFGEWSPFLVFNVADSAITIGVIVLLLRALFAGSEAKKLENDDA